MSYHDKTYKIIPFGELSQAIKDVVQDTIFFHSTTAPDEVWVKYAGLEPAILSGYPSFTHAEMITEIAKVHWLPPEV